MVGGGRRGGQLKVWGEEEHEEDNQRWGGRRDMERTTKGVVGGGM